MNICEVCGTANNELESQCRVCGQPLSGQAEQTSQPVAVQNTPINAASPVEAPTAPPALAADSQPHLQMSSVRQVAPTGAPPMLGNAAPEETVTPEAGPDWDLPGFMQESGRQSFAAAQDSVNLISANDLPDWIRQIAEADAAKAEAEEMERAAKASVASEAPASLVPKSLPGETRVSAPTATTWLSKSSAAQESGDAWATEEAAAASWGNAPVAPPAHVAPPSYPTITPHTAYIPTTPSSTPESGKRGRFSLSSSPDSSDKPLYRSRPVQLAFLAVLLVVLLAFVL